MVLNKDELKVPIAPPPGPPPPQYFSPPPGPPPNVTEGGAMTMPMPQPARTSKEF